MIYSHLEEFHSSGKVSKMTCSATSFTQKYVPIVMELMAFQAILSPDAVKSATGITKFLIV
jgi:hypothetical protein